MMLNLIDALGAFGNPVGHLVAIMAFAVLAVVGDAVPHARRATPPDVTEPSE